jgi:hypothetical protein
MSRSTGQSSVCGLDLAQALSQTGSRHLGHFLLPKKPKTKSSGQARLAPGKRRARFGQAPGKHQASVRQDSGKRGASAR